MGSVVKTEVILDKESVREIIVGEIGKALTKIPDFMGTMVKEVMFCRPPKRYSYDDDKPTFYESVIQKTLKPMIEEEVKRIAENHRPELSAMIKKAFKTNVLDMSEFEKRLIEKLGQFASNIDFYVAGE